MKFWPCFIAILLSFLPFSLLAQPSSDSVIVKEVISVPKPDTLIVTVSEWPALFGKEIPVILDEIDLPKLNGPCNEERRLAEQAWDYVKEKVANAHSITLQHMQRDKYFKIRAQVYVDDTSLNAALLSAGLAVPHRGRAPNWCHLM